MTGEPLYRRRSVQALAAAVLLTFISVEVWLDSPRNDIGPAHVAGGPTLRAIERDVDGDFFVSESIVIVLTYNVDRRLVHHSVKSMFTGP